MTKPVFNPYLPQWEYIPDGEPYVFGERLYVFGSHDRFDGDRYCANDYVSWSAPLDDLSDWRYDGVIYRATQDPHNADGAMRLFAPDVARGPDGRYYLYYALSARNAVSVAVSDTPNGRYTFLSDICHADGTVSGEKPGDCFQFDPGVLVDDDGKIYLYTGFSPDGALLASLQQRFGARVSGEGSSVIELEPDMKTVKTPCKPLIPGWQNARGSGFEGHEFFEASSIRKFGGDYYFVYSSLRRHELCYATSRYPDRDFSYRGVLHSNADAAGMPTGDMAGTPDGDHGAVPGAKYYWGNNHGSIVEIHGAYFIFGHRQTNTHEFSRQGVAEKLSKDGNGGFSQAEMTSCGLNGAPLAGKGRYGAGIACNLQSAKGPCTMAAASKESHPFITQNAPDYDPDAPDCGGLHDAPWQYIRNLRDGSAAGFKYFAIETVRALHVELRGNAHGELVCRFTRKGERGAEAAVPIAVSASEGDWQTFSAETAVSGGVYELSFTYQGTGSVDFRSFTLE
ncbi:MAG: family 43 glycosylhydrolase [Spirochaetaceae bacterium]|jgi:hypothetical protein|nr:family 43 glycosylhydrolase [Spirochaetaceae bacterium]